MVAAAVIEVLDDQRMRQRGEFEFAATPSSGHLVDLLGSCRDSPGVFRVLSVEHTPVKLPKLRVDDTVEAEIVVYVEFIQRVLD